MKKSTPFLLFLCLSTLLAAGADDAALQAKDREGCRKNLQTIYNAIQAYRKDHKALPPYLSSLVPEYLHTEAVLLCPLGERENRPPTHPSLADPKLKCSYVFQFSALPMGSTLRGGTMTMEDGKRLQMAIAGGAVPLVSCYVHEKAIHVGFDGSFSESEGDWEHLHEDKILMRDLYVPKRILATLMHSLGEVKNDVLALDRIQDWAEPMSPVATGKELTDAQKKANAEVAGAALKGVQMVDQFLTEFPQTTHAAEAKSQRRNFAFTAALAGDPTGRKLFKDLSEQAKGSGTMTEDEGFELRSLAMQLEVPEYDTEPFLRACRQLMKDFPKREDPQFALLSVVDRLNPERAKALLEEVMAAPASDMVRQQAQRLLSRPSILGKPLEIQFEAVDGRSVDVAKLKGKVVLVNFWATWDGASLGEVPRLKSVYDSLHDQSFEIVGISSDWDKGAVVKFLQAQSLPWPQFCDGKGWQNRFGEKYAISGFPTMWLVGKDGNVADLNGREDLAAKVKKLLTAP